MSRHGPATPAIATTEWLSALYSFSIRRDDTSKPSVACRSPAITTPSAKRSARMVVAWAPGSKGHASPGAACGTCCSGSMCGKSCRNRSKKLDPV